jgi:hypothetical protein
MIYYDIHLYNHSVFVEDGISYLKDIVPYGTEDLLLYFDHTYVNGKFRQGRPCKNSIHSTYRLQYNIIAPLHYLFI